MIEEIGGEDAAPADAAGDAAAWALLGRASRQKADAYPDEQTSLIRLQKEHLHEQRLLLLVSARFNFHWRRQPRSHSGNHIMDEQAALTKWMSQHG